MKPQNNTFALEKPVQLLMIDVEHAQIKERSDEWTDYFLYAYFLGGLLFAPFYNTWSIAIGVGGLSLLAYVLAKFALPESTLYQYVLSTVLGVFMAQYIYQMHGMFEMHFFAFIGSAILITYQNWKLQIPLIIVVTIHHAVFGYLQFIGTENVYFTELTNMSVQTFIIHIVLAGIIFGICGAWSYFLKKYSDNSLEQAYQMAHLLREAEIQKEEANKAHSELDKFVYSVSHDLRAPLLSMKGLVDITEAETREELTKTHMRMVRGSVNVLDTFIGEILEYSRNMRTEIKREEIDFKKLLDEITGGLQFMNGAKNHIQMKIEVKSYETFYTDKNRLSLVLNNLISNSIKYYNPNEEHPYVKVSVETRKDQVLIEVEDNGIGISEEYQHKIFEMFYRVSENSTGSGLGLYIVKEGLDKLKGIISVYSKPGVGTKFSVKIPNLLYQ